MLRTLAEYAAFFREFRHSFTTTGAIAPSGRFLAKALTRRLRFREPTPIRVLEVGPGTGAVTREIVRHIQPQDQFDIVELNERFVEHLRRRFTTEPRFTGIANQSRVLHLPIQQLTPTEPYDVIISGLPLNNFPVALVRELLRKFKSLAGPGGSLSYFEYLAIRKLKACVGSRRERKRLLQLDRVLTRHLERFETAYDRVLINLPPAIVHHLRFGD